MYCGYIYLYIFLRYEMTAERVVALDINNVLLAFGLTLFAGLSTGIGSALAFFTKRTNEKFLSAALGFSAGVMLYVSFIEIFVKAKSALIAVYGAQKDICLPQ